MRSDEEATGHSGSRAPGFRCRFLVFMAAGMGFLFKVYALGYRIGEGFGSRFEG